MNQRLTSLSVILVTGLVLSGGCVTTVETVTPVPGGARPVATAGPATAGPGSTASAGPLAEPAGTRVTTRLLTQIAPRGTVPYDDTTLPLVSPDGRFIATQTGIGPAWATILAGRGAAPPLSTRVEIYEVPTTPGASPRPIAAVPDQVLLGRAATDAGFLVEAPRAGGSRWIGVAAWATGEVTWLVTGDTTVNAFATLGPAGRLAWCRRDVEGDHFSLVVRHDGREWALPAEGGDWLMPTWSGVDDGLFVLRLEGDRLHAMHGTAVTADELMGSARWVALATGDATIRSAFQTLNAHVVTDLDAPGRRGRLEFYHPSRTCAAVWQPPSPLVLLDRGSFAGAVDQDDDGYALVTTREHLVRRSLADPADRINVIAGMHVPRPVRVTGPGGVPLSGYVLLQPGRGVIALTGLHLLQ